MCRLNNVLSGLRAPGDSGVAAPAGAIIRRIVKDIRGYQRLCCATQPALYTCFILLQPAPVTPLLDISRYSTRVMLFGGKSSCRSKISLFDLCFYSMISWYIGFNFLSAMSSFVLSTSCADCWEGSGYAHLALWENTDRKRWELVSYDYLQHRSPMAFYISTGEKSQAVVWVCRVRRVLRAGLPRPDGQRGRSAATAGPAHQQCTSLHDSPATEETRSAEPVECTRLHRVLSAPLTLLAGWDKAEQSSFGCRAELSCQLFCDGKIVFVIFMFTTALCVC